MESMAINPEPRSASLLSVTFELQRPEEISLSWNTGYVVYGAFLDLLRQSDPSLAAYLHSASREKPFTLSGLYALSGRGVNGDSSSANSRMCFRVTGFSKEIILWLARCVENPPLSIDLLGHDMEVVRIAPTDDFRSGCVTFEQLYSRIFDLNVALPRYIRMRFLTPTSFRSNGQNIPFPLPRLVFYTLCQKWNTYAPIHLGEFMHRLIEETVTLSGYRLTTETLEFDKYKQVGFVGDATFLLSKKLPDLWVRAVHLLADFAFYAGVGYKTTMGMGQVRAL